MIRKNLSGLSIYLKIWMGFGTILLILAISLVIFLYSSNKAQQNIDHVISNTHQLVAATNQVNVDIEKSSSALAYYLLTTEKPYLDEYLSSLDQVDASLSALLAVSELPEYANMQQQTLQLQEQFAAFKNMRRLIQKVVSEENLNYPALYLTQNELEPLIAKVSSGLARMLAADKGKASSRIQSLRFSWADLSANIHAYLAFRQSGGIKKINSHKWLVTEQFKKLNQLESAGLLRAKQRRELSTIRAAIPKFMLKLNEIVTAHSDETWRRDVYLAKHKISPLLEQMSQSLLSLTQTQVTLQKQVQRDMLAEMDSDTLITATWMLFGFCFGLVVAYLISSNIKRRLDRAVTAMTDIASGQDGLNYKQDEQGNDELTALAVAFNAFVDKIRAVVERVTHSSSMLADEANRMLEVTSETKLGVVLQQDETNKIAMAVRMMSDSVLSVAGSAVNASTTSKRASETANNGKDLVNNTVENINSLALEVEAAASVIRSLEKESTDIGAVVSVIRNISEQTNLLALNAAIEAARAGEYGRGFAVVADEVRSLSNSIQLETEHISKKVKKLQAGTQEAVQVMERGTKDAKQSVVLAAEASASLSDITTMVNSVTEGSELTEQSLNIQSQVANDVNDKIKVISEIADTTANNALITANSANEFNAMAAELQGLVQQFLEPNASVAQQAIVVDAVDEETLNDGSEDKDGIKNSEKGDIDLF